MRIPSEVVKNLHLQIDTKRSNDGQVLNNDVILSTDDKKYTVGNELVLSETAPSFKILFTHPDGKSDQLVFKIHKVSERQFDGEVKVIYTAANFNFDGTFDADLEDVENFAVKFTIDSPALKLNKVVAEAHNKPGAKGAKRIQFSATSESKNLLSGRQVLKSL